MQSAIMHGCPDLDPRHIKVGLVQGHQIIFQYNTILETELEEGEPQEEKGNQEDATWVQGRREEDNKNNFKYLDYYEETRQEMMRIREE